MRGMSHNLARYVSLLLAVTSGVLAISDQIIQFYFISPKVAQYWPLVLSGAIALDKILLLIGDYMDDGIINKSFKRLGFLFLVGGLSLLTMVGCSGCTTGPLGRTERTYSPYYENGRWGFAMTIRPQGRLASEGKPIIKLEK